jgi:hypothetical protein
LESQGKVAVGPSPILRGLAGFSYLAVFSVMFAIGRPERRFFARHCHVALVVHLLRAVWVGSILAFWWQTERFTDIVYSDRDLLIDLGLLLLAGVPRLSTIDTSVLPWVATPLVLLWLLSLTGMYLAMTGRTADFRAFAHADWSDIVPHWHRRVLSPEEERRRARIARQRQLDKLQRSTKTMGVERARRERMSEIEDQVQRLQAEQEHINQLLGLGEISQRRYDSLSADIELEIEMLRAKLSELSQRNINPRQVPTQLRVGRLDRQPESAVDTIAIVTPSGVPVFTYGVFQLDEALVAGILSAFDSISEEVFGSRVHKTELAEGQVMHFAHGQFVVILAVFADEPSPRQIEDLRTMLRQFEAANKGPLARQQYDPQYLIAVHPPFEFRDRDDVTPTPAAQLHTDLPIPSDEDAFTLPPASLHREPPIQ